MPVARKLCAMKLNNYFQRVTIINNFGPNLVAFHQGQKKSSNKKFKTKRNFSNLHNFFQVQFQNFPPSSKNLRSFVLSVFLLTKGSYRFGLSLRNGRIRVSRLALFYFRINSGKKSLVNYFIRKCALYPWMTFKFGSCDYGH